MRAGVMPGPVFYPNGNSEDIVSSADSAVQRDAQVALFEAIASQAQQQAGHKDHGAVAAALKDLAEAFAWAANQHERPSDQ
jgi:hypothetical protein